MAQSTPTFVSIIPNLVGGEGHIIPYHQAVGKAIQKLDWKHSVAVPTDAEIADLHQSKIQNPKSKMVLPACWQACLSSHDLEKEGGFLDKILKIPHSVSLGFSIANYLRKEVIYKSEYSIIFLERFIHLQLLALAIAILLIPRKDLSVWLLYRRDAHQDKTRSIYKLLNNLIKFLLKKGKFKLLTDSDLLSQSLSNYFQESVTVMPIPHTDINCNHLGAKQGSKILCWWAGSPRMEKGWEAIKELVNTPVSIPNNICLVASESSLLKPVSAGIQVKLIQNSLTRDQYDYWLCHSDFILLPYISEAYRERTSGIFTECIIVGKLPLVTPNTWMANELVKYHLDELILDWHDPQLVMEKITSISQSSHIKDKLMQMQKEYLQLHSINSYATKIRQIQEKIN